MKVVLALVVVGGVFWLAGCHAGGRTGRGGDDTLGEADLIAREVAETSDATVETATDSWADPGGDESEAVEVGVDTGTDGPPDAQAPLCCLSDAQCPQGWECVPIPGEMGVCKPIPESGACWSGADCDPDQVCVGAVPCRCGQDDTRDGCDIPGRCVERVAGCCDSDWDCPARHVCTAGNVCRPEPAAGECWTDADCYNTQTCEGAAVCPCGAICDIAHEGPGRCTPLPGGCCYSDDGCGEGEVCRFVDEVGHLPGRCVLSPLGPHCLGDAACCWEDEDCPAGFCEGAYGCGCVALCPVCGVCADDKMGFCRNWDIQVDLHVESATCEVSGIHPAFTSYRLSLVWHSSSPAKSTIEVTLNAFTGLEGSVQVDEGFQHDHAFILSLSHWFFSQVPRVGDAILVRVRVTGQTGQKGLSAPVPIEVTQAIRDCLYPFDSRCSDGGPIVCRAIPPPCDPDKVMAAIAGCQRCVFPETCTCDDGSQPVCTIPPPVCEGNTVLAIQNGCFQCVSPFSCNSKGW